MENCNFWQLCEDAYVHTVNQGIIRYTYMSEYWPWLLRHMSHCDTKRWMLPRKIPGAALWTSSACTASRHLRWIVCPSEPFLGDKKWCNHRERGLDCMEGDLEPPTWISARAVIVLAVWGLALSWSRMTPRISLRTRIKTTSLQWKHPGSWQKKKRKPRPSTQVQERLCWPSLIRTVPFW